MTTGYRATASLRALLAPIALLAMTSACNSNSPPEVSGAGPVPVAAIRLTPAELEIPVGAAVRLNVTLADPAGNVLPDRTAGGSLLTPGPDDQPGTVVGDSRGRSGRIVTWRSETPAVAMVDGRGLVTGVGPGKATITATSEGRSGSARVTVGEADTGSLSLVPARATLSAGESLALEALPPSAAAMLAWSVDAPARALVNDGGRVFALAPGAVMVTASDGRHSASAELTIAPAAVIRGLDFPGNAGVETTLRFEFTAPPAACPATYIWRAYPRQQQSYYTAFFWGNNGDFYSENTYYGFHPYPDWSTEHQHFWEIATPPGSDVVSAVHVVYDRWYTQVAVCRTEDEQRVLEFYWDWPDRAKVIRHRGPIFSDPPEPALVVGDAPWNAGNEVWSGVLRGFQFYDAALAVDDIGREIAAPGSTRAPWYLKLDPAPDDIADESGHGNDPAWVGSERPTLWTGRMTPDGIILTAAGPR